MVDDEGSARVGKPSFGVNKFDHRPTNTVRIAGVFDKVTVGYDMDAEDNWMIVSLPSH
jgi:hypothetical protein